MNDQQIQLLSLSDSNIISAVKLCACGCGKPVTKLSNKWINGHACRDKNICEKMVFNHKQAMFKKYGCQHALQLKKFKDKFKKTCKKNFGVENPSESNLIKQKKIDTTLIHFNVSNVSQSIDVKEKKKQKNLLTLGVENPSQSINIKEKKKKTCLGNYGVNSPYQSKEIRDKGKQTCLKNYGVINPSQVDEIKEKKKLTSINNYGVPYYFQTPIGLRNIRINCIKHVEIQKLNNEPLMPRIGNQERPFLDELQKHVQFYIIRNDHSFAYTIARFPDGHIPELKLFIQFDERHHFKDEECTIYREDDIQCTKDLESISGYHVFRVSEKRWKENQENIINEFKTIIETLNQKEINETS